MGVEQIEYITASGPYAELHVSDKTYVIRERMQSGEFLILKQVLSLVILELWHMIFIEKQRLH